MEKTIFYAVGLCVIAVALAAELFGWTGWIVAPFLVVYAIWFTVSFAEDLYGLVRRRTRGD